MLHQIIFEQDHLLEPKYLAGHTYEMGHAVGLRHRKTTGVLMNGDTYEDVFKPDEIDFKNLEVLYGCQE